MTGKQGFYLAVLGLAAGFCGAALGIGGGTIIIPALVLLFGYDIKKTLGTSLATAVPIAFVGTVVYYVINSANIRMCAGLATIFGSVIGALFGVELASKIKSSMLRVFFALLLFFVGLKLFGILELPTRAVTNNATYPLLAILGLAAGTASACFGIGGGILLVPGFLLFFGFSIHEAIATSLFVIMPTAFAGCIFHKKPGNIDFVAIKFMAPASLVGAAAGAAASNSLPSGVLKTVLGGVMIFCSARIFLKKK